MGVAQHVDLLGEDGSRLGIDCSEVLDLEGRQTDVGTIVSLRVTVEVVTEMRGQFPIAVNLVGRRQRNVEEGILITVLTLATTILQQCQGVGL